MRYYIADCHFYHESLNTKMDYRNFPNMDTMNQYMIEKWNTKVHNNDDVIILGDLSWGKTEETNSLLDQLNGRLHLITGNHDKFTRNQSLHSDRFEWIKPYEELQDNKRKVILCHYPIMCYNGQYQLDENGNPKTYMLYGHVHNTQDQMLLDQFQTITRNTWITNKDGTKRSIPCNMINCFCMYSDYTPLTLDEWIICDQKRRAVMTTRKTGGLLMGITRYY